MTAPDHRVRGVDHVAYPTFDPAATVKFYRDVLGFPVVHSICAAGWGPEHHPDFTHFFFDIGNDDRLAFFYYFGLEPFGGGPQGDAYSRFGEAVPLFFIRSRHLAIHVDSQEDLMEYRRRLDGSEWPVEMQIQHETIESIYTHDPNGYMIELTRALRPVTPQEDLDAELTIEALIEVTSQPDPSMSALLTRKAELIVERAAAWEEEQRARAGRRAREEQHAAAEEEHGDQRTASSRRSGA
ncbi:MAG TPA: VOC family protein [Streptosporangiaceae bacterium]